MSEEEKETEKQRFRRHIKRRRQMFFDMIAVSLLPTI